MRCLPYLKEVGDVTNKAPRPNEAETGFIKHHVMSFLGADQQRSGRHHDFKGASLIVFVGFSITHALVMPGPSTAFSPQKMAWPFVPPTPKEDTCHCGLVQRYGRFPVACKVDIELYRAIGYTWELPCLRYLLRVLT